MGKKAKIKEKPTQNNVVTFPLHRQLRTDLTLEQINENKKEVRKIHINETLELVPELLFNTIITMGFDLGSRPDLEPDITLILESVNSMLRRYYGLKHPLQKIAVKLSNDFKYENEKDS